MNFPTDFFTLFEFTLWITELDTLCSLAEPKLCNEWFNTLSLLLYGGWKVVFFDLARRFTGGNSILLSNERESTERLTSHFLCKYSFRWHSSFSMSSLTLKTSNSYRNKNKKRIKVGLLLNLGIVFVAWSSMDNIDFKEIYLWKEWINEKEKPIYFFVIFKEKIYLSRNFSNIK